MVDHWTPTVGNHTPLQALTAACYFTNATRSSSFDDVKLGWNEGGLSGAGLFKASVILIIFAIFSIILDYKWRDARKSWTAYLIRSVLLVANLGVGITVFYATTTLRSYMVSSKWLKDDKEGEMSHGQFVPILLAVFVFISAAQSWSGKQPFLGFYCH